MKFMLKTTVFSLFLVLGVIFALPQKANALLLDSLFEDAPNGPHCLFMDCHDQNPNYQQPASVDNSINNSYNNNTNSFNNGTVYTGTPTYHYPTPTYNYPSLDVSCYAVSNVGSVGSTIEWRATTYGGNGSYYITWAGTDGLTGQGSSAIKTYVYPGTKTATISVTSGGQTRSTNCAGSVVIRDHYNTYNNYYQTPTYYYTQPTYYQPQPTYYYTPVQQQYYYQPISYANGFQIGCGADTVTTKIGSPVTWSAEATYNGYQSGFSYSWTGTDGLSGYGPIVSKSYSSTGIKTATVTVVAPNGQSQTATCSNSVTVKSATIAKKPVVSKEGGSPSPVQTVYVNTPNPKDVSAASLFSLNNVPWGWVAVLIILILIGLVLYLIFNKRKI